MEDILNRVQEEIHELIILDNYLFGEYDCKDSDKNLIISDIRENLAFFRKLLLQDCNKIREKL